LKTVHFIETIVSGNFLPWSSAICVFFAALYLLWDGGSELFCSHGGVDPQHLKGALGQQAACQLLLLLLAEMSVTTLVSPFALDLMLPEAVTR
jgi:hypothetical protein